MRPARYFSIIQLSNSRAINLQARRAEAVAKGGFCWIHLEIFLILQ